MKILIITSYTAFPFSYISFRAFFFEFRATYIKICGPTCGSVDDRCVTTGHRDGYMPCRKVI